MTLATRPGHSVARVLLHNPLPQLDRLLDYAIPQHLRESAVPGVRVRVPLRGRARLVDAYIVEVGEAVDPDRPLSEVDAVLSGARVLPDDLYRLARRVADRAAGSASDLLRLVIPRRQAKIEAAWAERQAHDEPADDRQTPEMDASRVPASSGALAQFPGLADALVAGDRLALDAPPRLVTPDGGETFGEWAALLAASAAQVYRAGRSAVIVVPDHGDLEQVLAALALACPEADIARCDGELAPAARSRAYLRMLEDRPCIAVGNRSAVYAPVRRIGLIALWDDGDPLLDEPLAPYVHARDAALLRQELAAEQAPCALLIAGHTRTSDVQRLIDIGWMRDVAPARRVTPAISLDAPIEGEDDARAPRVSSSAFRTAREAIALGPVLVQVARPGYAPVLACADCGTPARCAHCGGPLHAAARGATPACTRCGRSAAAWTCSHCRGSRFRFASSGSRRTADELGRAFPGVRVIVSDGARRIARVDATPALVIATRGAEPIPDGGYRAVILLDGERMLMAEALRIGESCLRWWSNAAALAAPGAPVHLVGVRGEVAQAFATWTQPRFAHAQLAERAPVRMPPTVRTAIIEGDADAVDAAVLAAKHAAAGVDALGPVPLPVPITGDAPTAPQARALVRFDYAAGAAVAGALRSAVVDRALRARRPARPRQSPETRDRARPRATLKVRLDPVEPDLDVRD